MKQFKLIVLIVILLYGLRHYKLFPEINIPLFSPIVIIPMICIIMVAVFVRGKRVIKTQEFETSQPVDELLARNKSAVEKSTGQSVTTNQENKSNSWLGGSIFFFSKKELDEKND